MALSDVALRIAHIASLHCGEPTFQADLLRTTVERINELRPDLVAVAGDLTGAGYQWEFEEAVRWLDRIDAPKVVVPGNHDSRNVGYVHFERHCNERFSCYRQSFDAERSERLRAGGVTVVAADSSEPDLDEGHIGRERYAWIREQFSGAGNVVKVFLLHHHLVAVPGAGRDLNIITDAGDLLPLLAQAGVDVILTGHRHVPYFWGLNGMLLCNAGTVSTRRLRGRIPPSWNELRVDASTVKVYLHYPDGRRELSVIRSRATHTLIREAFFVTDQFMESNRILWF